MKRKFNSDDNKNTNITKQTITTHFFFTHRTPRRAMSYDVGNPAPGLGQAQKCGGLNRLMVSQPLYNFVCYAPADCMTLTV